MDEEGSNHPSSIRCGTCYKILDRLSSISKISGDESRSDIVHDLLVCDAVAYIYGLSSEDLQKILKNYSIDLSSNCIDLSSVVLCASCALLLQESYRICRRFESTIHPSSFVDRVQKFRYKDCQLRNQEQLKSTVNLENSGLENLLDDFNFESEEHETEEETTEEKHFPVDDSELILHEPKTDKSRKRRDTLAIDVFVKLEKLSDEDLKRHCKSKNVSGKAKKHVRNSNKKETKPMQKGKTVAEKSLNSINLEETTEKNTKNLETGPFKCDLCEKTFASRLYIKRVHLPSAHWNTASVTCEICGKLLKSRLGLYQHMRKKHTEKLGIEKVRVRCKFCDKLLFEDNLKVHMKTHSGSRPTFKCQECDKVFAHKVTYDDHIVIHRKDFTPFQCSYCGKTFHKKAVLKIHETIHTAERKFECHECGRKYLALFNLKKHIETHAAEKKYVCDECGKSFKHKQYFATHLKLHKEIAEKGENSVKCADCGKIYKHSIALRKHRNRTHGDDSKKTIYKCSYCAKILSSPVNLKIHENNHKTKA